MKLSAAMDSQSSVVAASSECRILVKAPVLLILVQQVPEVEQSQSAIA